MPIFYLLTGLWISASAWAYPEFIGYKYSSCLTCHYNGNGGGALSDYGRALWASEIGGRLFSGPATGEQLGEASGFLGRTQLPWWVRPGLKSRFMEMKPNPGAPDKSRSILMQAEGNVALFFDQDQRHAVVASVGYVPTPQALKTSTAKKPSNFVSREHYYRQQLNDALWLYAGFMDKVYGVRIVDHTAYSRAMVGLNQTDQAHSLVMQYIKPKYELSFDGFAGNLYQEADLRQVGGSFMGEYEVKEAWRLGASLLASANKFVGQQRAAIHSRSGLGYGSALLFELGRTINKPKSGAATNGFYLYGEAIQRLVRGYHLFVAAQAAKSNAVVGTSTNLLTEFGFLIFPQSRFELRVEFINGEQLNDSSTVTPDSWTALAQVHISL